MPGVGEVLFRHKVTSPRWLIAFTALLPSTVLGVLGLVMALGASLVGGLVMIAGGVAIGLLLALLMAIFSTGRIVVSEGELHVQIGPLGPKITIDEIASVTIAPSGFRKLGMGTSIDLSGNRYIRMWGDDAKAVHVKLKSGKRVMITMKEPDAMAAALQQALDRRKRLELRVAQEQGDEEVEEATEAAPEAAAKARIRV
jgi:hypothetical protein